MIDLLSTSTEKEYQKLITDYASAKGWKWYHTHDSRRSPAGFPDLVLWRDRVIYIEVKRKGGRVSPAQALVHAQLRTAGAEVYTVWPGSWEFIQEVLR